MIRRSLEDPFANAAGSPETRWSTSRSPRRQVVSSPGDRASLASAARARGPSISYALWRGMVALTLPVGEAECARDLASLEESCEARREFSVHA
jgi:hypothetical protein